ncbi:MAG: right-handed parallel beta-helix repeat-containing protein [Agathobacter sp.]|nr:right-handed parallel beta-helix repeat-containing protein [Agathobacter sp.]
MKNQGIVTKIAIGMIVSGLAVTMSAIPAKDNSVAVVQAAAMGYEVDGTTLTVNEADVTRGVNSAVSYAIKNYRPDKVYTIKVPAGTYEMMGGFNLPVNVKLDLTGVTLKKTDTGNMVRLRSLAASQKLTGYGEKGTTEIVGGTFIGNDSNSSSMVRLAHGTNVTLDGCTFVGGGCAHQLEIASIDGFTVKNCTFRDAKGNGTNEKQEALQFDVPCSTYVFNSTELDGTPMKNVKVEGNTFQNVLRGLGSHSMLVGVYHENIDIVNNTFENVDGECIVALNYKNCNIKNNRIKNCGAGILFQNFKPGVKAVYTTIYDGTKDGCGVVDNNCNTIISGNDITLSENKHADEYVGIKVYGFDLKEDTKATGKGSSDLIPKGNYSVENVTISNNKIKTCGHGIHLLDVTNARISGNTIENTKSKSDKDGIFAEYASKEISIQKNTIKKAGRYGIFLQNDTTAKNIKDNKILKSCGKYGIGLYDHSKVLGDISGNTIEKSKNNGIFLNDKCSAKNIKKNIIKNSGGFGIGLYDNSSVSGEISGNHISDSKSHGISISLKCYAKKISGNTIKNSATYPIVINTTSKKKITITGNKITTKKGQEKIHVINGVVKE